MPKILITGISGFIGRNLALKLKSLGHEVIGIDANGLKGFGLIEKDIFKLKELDCDIVIHLAAKTTHHELVDDAVESFKTNFLGTFHLLQLFNKSNASHFIYPSSGKVYGKQEKLPFNENLNPNPTTTLGITKKMVEDLMKFFSLQSDKTYTALRIFNVYGPGQRESFLIPTILKQLDKKEIILGDIEGKRDFFYIDDLVDAFVRVINAHLKGFNVFNVGSGKSTSPREIVSIIGKIKNKKIKIEIDKARLREGELKEEIADISKIKKLGWMPKPDIIDGLKRML